MGFGMFGNFAGGLVQGVGMGLKIMDEADQLDERRREQQLAKDSAAAFGKIGKDDDQGFVDSGGQIKVGDQQFNDMATAKKFASDKDLASFATDGASDPANNVPEPAAAPLADQTVTGQDQAPAPQLAVAAPADPSAITQTRLATPLPVQTLDKDGKPAAMKTYGMQDYLNYRAQRAGELGLGQQAHEAMAKALASRFSNAAMKAYAAGDYDEVYRLHNVLPDGYTVKRQVVPGGPDGTGGGIVLTMLNDKTGQTWGQPIKFANDREAAGAFVAAAQQKLPEWLIQQGRQDNDTTRALYKMQIEQQRISQRYDAMENSLLAKMAGLGMKGAGSSAGGAKGDLAYGNDPRMSFAERWIKDGKGSDGQPVSTATQFQFMDNAERIGKNHPELSPAALSSVAYGATMHPEGVKPEVNPSTGDLMLTYRDPAYNAKDGNNVSQPYILQRSITPEMARQQGFDDKTMAKAATAVIASMPSERRQALELAVSDPDQMKAATQAIMDGYKQRAEQDVAANPSQASQIRTIAAQKASQDIAALSRNADWYRVYRQSQPVGATNGAILKQPGGLLTTGVADSSSGSTLDGYTGKLRDNTFAAYLRTFRGSQSPQAAGELAQMVKDYPQYLDQLTATERAAIGAVASKQGWASVSAIGSRLEGVLSSYGNTLRDNTFARTLRAFRGAQSSRAASDLAEMVKGNPQYLDQLTPEDRVSIEVASGKKL